MDQKIKLIISFVIPWLLFVAASIPLILNKIPPNGLYGFRTAKTLIKTEYWYKANRFGGLCLFISAVIALTGLILLFINKDRITFDLMNTIGFSLFAGPITVSIILTILYIEKL